MNITKIIQEINKLEREYSKLNSQISKHAIFKSKNNWVLFTVIRKLLKGFYLFY